MRDGEKPASDEVDDVQVWLCSCWQEWMDVASPPHWTKWWDSVPQIVRDKLSKQHRSSLALNEDDHAVAPNIDAAPHDEFSTVHFEDHQDTQAYPGGSETRPRVPQPRGYELHEELGRGGMGVVYRATDTSLARSVAVKMIRGGANYDSEQLERFQSEAQAMAQLQHSGIVQVYDAGELDGSPYIACEYVEGSSLDKQLNGEPQEPRHAAQTVMALAEAVDFAHQAGIIHRDLKPANVLVDRQGALKVTDFGLAKRLEPTDSQVETQTGAIMGTPSYMSPEQAKGTGSELSPATDVYALGAILYEMLTGRPPFRASSVIETLQHVIGEEPAAPRSLNQGVPRDLETICLKCLQKDPLRRYASAKDLAEELDRFQKGEPVQARPVSSAERLWRWSWRNPWLAGMSATTLLLLLVVAVGATSAAFWLNVAREAKEDALEQALASQREAEGALVAERTAKETARHAVDNYVATVAKSELLEERRFQDLRLELLAAALEYYQEMVREAKGKTDRQIAGALQNLGFLCLTTGRDQDAVDAYQQSASIWRTIAKDQPDDLTIKAELAKALCQTGAALNSVDDTESAIGLLKEAERIRRVIYEVDGSEDHREDLAKVHHDIALTYGRGNQPEKHAQHLNMARSLGLDVAEDDASDGKLLMIANTQNSEGLALQKAGDLAEAVERFEAAIATLDKIKVKDDRGNAYMLKAVATQNIAVSFLNMNEHAKAYAKYAEAIKLLAFLGEQNPQRNDLRVMLAAAHRAGGQAALQLGNSADAERHLQSAVSVYRQIADIDRTAIAIRHLSESLEELAEIYADNGDLNRSGEAMKESRQLLAESLKAAKPDPASLLRAGMLALNQSNKLVATGSFEEALLVCEKGLAEMGDHTFDSKYPACFLKAVLHANHGKAARGLDEFQQAEKDFQQAAHAARESLQRKESGNADALLRFSLLWKSQCQRQQGKVDDAIETMAKKRAEVPSSRANDFFEDGAELLACYSAVKEADPRREGWKAEAFAMLQKAAEAGLTRSAKFDDDERLDVVRDDPQWKALYESLPEAEAKPVQ